VLHRAVDVERFARVVLPLLLAVGTACSSPASPAAEQRAGSLAPSPSVTTSTSSTTSTTSTAVPPCVPPAFLTTTGRAPVPDDLARLLTARMSDIRFAGVTVSASVWMDGFGEVVAHEADTPLLPASNQKLLTALGTAMLLPPDGRFTTEVRMSGTRDGDTLTGDLVLVASGDPSLTRTGPNSLDALALQLRDAGVRRVTGSLVVDVSRHEVAQTAEGWQDWQIPEYAGPLSAFVLDDNRYRRDPTYLAHPAVQNGGALRDALGRHGVVVAGAVVEGLATDAMPVLATTRSAPFSELSAEMLLRSDNEHAEMLVREIARQATGSGVTAAGVAEVQDVLEDELCLELEGRSGDGSGLSRSNFRSARELRTLLQAALGSPWGPALDAALPVAAESGTLARRFGGTSAAGNVRAKTGSIIGGRALTGHLVTAGGRHVVFSVIVNGDGSPAAQAAIDALVVTLAEDRS
jgi:D-alanyl-D-alanine carboxypeptidase/D-alanyl-D-alanine-endopeptidase (penicillin-binding protein 4)